MRLLVVRNAQKKVHIDSFLILVLVASPIKIKAGICPTIPGSEPSICKRKFKSAGKMPEIV